MNNANGKNTYFCLLKAAAAVVGALVGSVGTG
jgi:hypothetical protein